MIIHMQRLDCHPVTLCGLILFQEGSVTNDADAVNCYICREVIEVLKEDPEAVVGHDFVEINYN